MSCKCGGSAINRTVYEVGTFKDQEKFSEPVPELGSVVQLRTCAACGRCDRTVLYVNPKLIKEKSAKPPAPPSTNSLLDFF